MKKLLISTLIATSTLFAFGMGKGNCNARFTNVLNQYQKQPLTQEAKIALLHMREEEKLARDVYITLYKKWGLRIFANISKAEQHHMDMVKMLLDRYHLPDDAANTQNKVGVFNVAKFQKLYNELVAQGSKSRLAALKVGALVEDLDIYDLEEFMSKIHQKDILFVFKNLTKGSRNHMRAFMRMIKRFGGNYTPKYISQTQFNQIINSNMERGLIR